MASRGCREKLVFVVNTVMKNLLLWLTLSLGVAGCLQLDQDPTHKGDTLPTPDMSKIILAPDKNPGDVMVSGSGGAVPPKSQIVVTNTNTGETATGEAANDGSFVIPIANVEPDSAISISITTVDGVNTTLEIPKYQGPRLIPPQVVVAYIENESEFFAHVSGYFANVTNTINVRAINVQSKNVVDTATFPETIHDQRLQRFDLTIAARVGDEIIITGTDPAIPQGSSPGVRVVVQMGIVTLELPTITGSTVVSPTLGTSETQTSKDTTTSGLIPPRQDGGTTTSVNVCLDVSMKCELGDLQACNDCQAMRNQGVCGTNFDCIAHNNQ